MKSETVIVIVTPKAREHRVEDLIPLDPSQRMLRVWVTETPDHGRANRAMIDMVAHHLGVAPSLISIAHGRRGRRKLLRVHRAV